MLFDGFITVHGLLYFFVHLLLLLTASNAMFTTMKILFKYLVLVVNLLQFIGQ